MRKLTVLCAFAVPFNVTNASAQDIDVGRTEYQSSCASCHGMDGKGKGPLSLELKLTLTDLTALAIKNNGVFPLNAVYEVIDGRKSISAHGTRAMPIWGFRYTPSPNPNRAVRAVPPSSNVATPSPNQATQPSDEWTSSRPPVSYLDLSHDPELVVRNRILAIVDYLYRIQQKCREFGYGVCGGG